MLGGWLIRELRPKRMALDMAFDKPSRLLYARTSLSSVGGFWEPPVQGCVPGEEQPLNVFRVIPRDRLHPLRAGPARFHGPNDPPTSYLSFEPATAVFEVSQGLVEVRPERHRLIRARVRLSATLNLCDEGERARRGLTLEAIFGPKTAGDATHEARLFVARAARAGGAHGLFYPSLMDRPNGVNLVLFLETTPLGPLGEGARVEILDQDDDPADSSLAPVLKEIEMRLGPSWVEHLRQQRRSYDQDR